MNAEDFYKEYYPSKMHLFRDKFDRQLQIFGVDDIIDFAEEYHKKKLLSELAKAKALTEHLSQEERNEYFDLAIKNLK